MIAFFNGDFMEKDEITISPDDRGFLLADGFYEVIRKLVLELAASTGIDFIKACFRKYSRKLSKGFILHIFCTIFNNISEFKGVLMKTNTKIMLYLIILALLDMIIPIPFTALILIYVILKKPAWFINLVTNIYNS